MQNFHLTWCGINLWTGLEVLARHHPKVEPYTNDMNSRFTVK